MESDNNLVTVLIKVQHILHFFLRLLFQLITVVHRLYPMQK